MKHLGTQVLETERLILRPFTADDAPYMYHNWAGDPQVTRFLTWQPHADTAASLAHIATTDYENQEVYHWAIVLKELSQPIGGISVVGHDNALEMVHIGYCIGPRWWGRGIVAEALAALIRFFFEEVGVNRIETLHAAGNPNSGKVMQKCGLVYEGRLRQADRSNQGIDDAVRYAILREDYQTQKAPPLGGAVSKGD